MDEQEFQQRADEALSEIYKALGRAADEYGIEPDFTAGALSIEFDEPPGRFVLSPNSPVRQIWVSAHATSYKLEWDATRSAFVLPATGQSLKELVEDAIGRHLGQQVELA
jgi:CyaY protein